MILLFFKIILVSKSVADTLLKYRCIWDDEEPIITEAPVIIDTLKDLSTSENKKTLLLPDSSTYEYKYMLKFILCLIKKIIRIML